MSLGSAALGTAPLGSTAETAQTTTASLTASDADSSTVAGTRGRTAAPTAVDADTATAGGALGVGATLAGRDGDTATVAGGRGVIAQATAQDADQASYAFVADPSTQTVTRTLVWRETIQRTLDINTMSDIAPHDHYLAGESEVWEFTIQQDGSDYDLSGAAVSWALVGLSAEDTTDPILSEDDTGVSLSISDPDGDGTSERITLELDQGVTDGLSGYYTHVLEVDDSGPGLAKWAGDFRIRGL